ncbi:MAG: hypothetical protein KC422_01550 [Trueperaceae bacterium]|nr:hypothetical protein [Trueperaceae bacterium]
MKTTLRTLVFALALGFSIWTLAVSFSPISSNFQAGDEVSADGFNALFNAIGANFDAAKAAIDANEAAIASMSAKPAVSAGLVSNQAIPNNSVRKVNWNAESFDIGGFHDNATNNTRLTVPEAGIYQINALIAWETNGTGDRLLTVLKNGTLTQLSDTKTPVTGSSTSQSLSGMLELSAGDFLEVSVFQSSGTELDLFSTIPMQFSMVKVSEIP